MEVNTAGFATGKRAETGPLQGVRQFRGGDSVGKDRNCHILEANWLYPA
jgi:hypothetical protein